VHDECDMGITVGSFFPSYDIESGAPLGSLSGESGPQAMSEFSPRTPHRAMLC
jgi:hypothetical protein